MCNKSVLKQVSKTETSGSNKAEGKSLLGMLELDFDLGGVGKVLAIIAVIVTIALLAYGGYELYKKK